MAQHPLARTDGLTATPADDSLIVRGRDGHEVARLSPLEARLWRSADGQTSVLDLALFGPDDEGGLDSVWRALDHLADVGLLEARPAPPGSLLDLSRRKVLTGMAEGSLASVAAVAASGIALAAAAAAAKANAATHTKSPEHAGGVTTRVEAVKPKYRRRHNPRGRQHHR